MVRKWRVFSSFLSLINIRLGTYVFGTFKLEHLVFSKSSNLYAIVKNEAVFRPLRSVLNLPKDSIHSPSDVNGLNKG
jgi:hypothetical protein